MDGQDAAFSFTAATAAGAAALVTTRLVGLPFKSCAACAITGALTTGLALAVLRQSKTPAAAQQPSNCSSNADNKRARNTTETLPVHAAASPSPPPTATADVEPAPTRAMTDAAGIKGSARPRRTVLTFGTFDLFHFGHLRYLQRAVSVSIAGCTCLLFPFLKCMRVQG